MPLDRNADTLARILRNWQRIRHNHVLGETPAGPVNGVNVTFTLINAPNGGVALYKNGLRLVLTTSYTIVGKTITMVVAPAGGSVLLADYIY